MPRTIKLKLRYQATSTSYGDVLSQRLEAVQLDAARIAMELGTVLTEGTPAEVVRHPSVVDAYLERLLPRALVATPNHDEARVLTGCDDPPARDVRDDAALVHAVVADAEDRGRVAAARHLRGWRAVAREERAIIGRSVPHAQELCRISPVLRLGRVACALNAAFN